MQTFNRCIWKAWLQATARTWVLPHCLFPMGNPFVSDGQVTISFSSMPRVARAGHLQVIGSGSGEDGLDVSADPADTGVHTILSDCAASARGIRPGVDLAAMQGRRGPRVNACLRREIRYMNSI